MKKTSLIVVLTLFIGVMSVIYSSNNSIANSANPPDGNTGATMDNFGQECTYCHGGGASSINAIISSDIPPTGYLAGVTYNFTVTMNGAAAYGFEISPQTSTSNAGVGTLIAGIGTIVSGKYIKQSIKQTGASANWNFRWTAPLTSNTVTFFGGFVYANNNNSLSGDIVKKSSVTYSPNTTGIEQLSLSNPLILYPNPTNGAFSVEYTLLNSEDVSITITDNLGRSVYVTEIKSQSIGFHKQEINSILKQGLYNVIIATQNGIINKKLIVTK